MSWFQRFASILVLFSSWKDVSGGRIGYGFLFAAYNFKIFVFLEYDLPGYMSAVDFSLSNVFSLLNLSLCR